MLHGARAHLTLAQLVERWTVVPSVTGSIPVGQTFSVPVTQLVRVLVLCTKSREFKPHQGHFAPIAQPVERKAVNLNVAGSIPAGSAL